MNHTLLDVLSGLVDSFSDRFKCRLVFHYLTKDKK